MPTDFGFSLEELIRNPSSNIAKQITATGRLTTSRHQRGDRDVFNLNMRNLSEILMRVPAFRPIQNVLSMHEAKLGGDIGAILQRVPSAFSSILPGDIMARADSMGLDPVDPEGPTHGGSGGGGTIPGLVEPPNDLPWRAADRLQPNTHAAREFIRRTWGDVLSIGGYGERAGKSDHPLGLALDPMVSANSAMPSDHMKDVGTSISRWFIANPNVFGTKYVIWWQYYNSGAGWGSTENKRFVLGRKMDDRGGNTANHYDHPHISFNRQSSQGSTGGAWEGTDMRPMGGVPGQSTWVPDDTFTPE